MVLNIVELQKICTPDNIVITIHAAKRLEQRNIKLAEIIDCIINGEIIEQYPDDYPSSDKWLEDLKTRREELI